MAIEEFNSGRRTGFILIPESKNSWRWCGFLETPKSVVSSYLRETRPPAIIIPSSELCLVTMNCSYAQVVNRQSILATSNEMGFAVIIAAASQTACPPRQSQKATSQMTSLVNSSAYFQGPKIA